MATWSEAEADAAVKRYVDAADEGIAWLEARLGVALTGDAGLREAWRWTVRSGLQRDLPDEARVRFGLAHLFGRAVLSAVPGSRWVCWKPGRRVIGHHAPAITRDRFNVIPGLMIATLIGHVYDARTQELENWRRHMLDEDELIRQRDDCIESAAVAATKGPAPPRID